MSTKRAASSLHAVQVADDLSAPAAFLDCSTCKLPFRAYPLVFGCGHSVCSECADAMRACVPALCLLCQVPIASCLEDRGLGEFIQEALDGCASTCPSPDPRSAKKSKVSQAEDDTTADLLPLLDRSVAAQAAAQAKDGVLSNALLCVDVPNHAVDDWVVRVEEYRRTWLTRVQLLTHECEKALEAQESLPEVSAGQLAAVDSKDEGRACEAAETAKTMDGLLVVPTPLCTDTRLAVLCDQSAAPGCLEKRTRLQHFEVDAVRSCVSGEGLTAYANDGVARNVIRVTCMDSDGELADWATLADADVGLTANGATWQVASATVPEPGGVEVTYVVEEGLEEMEVGVSLCGVAVPGGPWRARAGFMAKGVFIATLPLLRGPYYNSGLAVSSNGSLLVASNADTNQLDVYRTEDGSHVRTLGCHGTGPGEFDRPYSLCMTARDTVLVGEFYNKRIQEVTLEGAHVKFIPVRSRAGCMAVHGDLVAVGRGKTSIELYSYTTGALVRTLPTVDMNAGHFCFAPDGEQLAVVGSNHIALVSVDGQSVRRIAEGDYFLVAFTCAGDVITSSSSGVMHVFSVADGELLRSWATGFAHPHMTVVNNRLYVMHDKELQVFE